jgi:hypothetical protein
MSSSTMRLYLLKCNDMRCGVGEYSQVFRQLSEPLQISLMEVRQHSACETLARGIEHEHSVVDNLGKKTEIVRKAMREYRSECSRWILFCPVSARLPGIQIDFIFHPWKVDANSCTWKLPYPPNADRPGP